MASTTRALHLGTRRCCAAAGQTAATTRPAAEALPRAPGLPRTPAAAAASQRGYATRAETSSTTAALDHRYQRQEMRHKIKRLQESGKFLTQPPFNARKLLRSPWNQGETDVDMISLDDGDDNQQGRDILTVAHAKLDEHRDRRHYARLAVWELPLLAKFAKPFEPPTADMPLRFRYTSYMGEFHPAERKAVVEFCPADLGLTPVQQDKLRKLVGPRYNPETDVIKMSCEMHEHVAQNKRHLGDLVAKLLAEAKDPSDTFEDVPLDTRHHTFKHKPKFPTAWRMTDARRAELQAARAQTFLLDQQRLQAGTIVDGAQRIKAAALAPPPEVVAEKVAVKVGKASGGQKRAQR